MLYNLFQMHVEHAGGGARGRRSTRVAEHAGGGARVANAVSALSFTSDSESDVKPAHVYSWMADHLTTFSNLELM